MSFRLPAIFFTLLSAMALAQLVQAEEPPSPEIHLELNTVQDTGTACRLTFVANNSIGEDIDKAVFETVIFDASGSVMLLSLFDFRDLPAGTPRVRQFDVPGTTCDAIGKVLINGANTCSAGGSDSDACGSLLNVESRIELELLG
ncbi:hypothetical protein ACFORG_00720 [Lutimaribacter marinistellae]|uniref:Tat pathway signal sequence domain protein n=1 Tax=Lutimaribacter marinistellae TaxID=1820329 RepID=A0ABV7T9I4_9RHOB